MSTRATDDDYLVPRRQAHCVLGLLFLLMVFDFIDRQVLASLLPAIKLEWSLSDRQLGMLVSAVNVAIAILALPVAVVVDRWSRTRAIGIMAVFWSLATAGCMLAGNFTQMLVARFAIGTGEAGYVAGGNALLSALYPARLRGTVIGIFQSATMIGTVAGVVLGGVIAAKWGWRSAFGVVAIPGLALAVLMFFVKDYKTIAVSVRDEASGAVRKLSWLGVLGMIVSKPVLLVLFLGQAAQLFFVSVLGNWLPSFLNRFHGLPLDKAGVRAGLTLLVAAVGVALGGWIIDKIAGARLQRRLLGAAVLAFITAAFFIAAFRTEALPLQSVLMFCGAFFMLTVLGPVMAAVTDLVHPGMRTSALGMMITFTNLFGMGLGPTITGMLSDQYDLRIALLIVSFMPVLAGIGYLLAGLGYERGRVGAMEVRLTAA